MALLDELHVHQPQLLTMGQLRFQRRLTTPRLGNLRHLSLHRLGEFLPQCGILRAQVLQQRALRVVFVAHHRFPRKALQVRKFRVEDRCMSGLGGGVANVARPSSAPVSVALR